ncbi:MAG: multiheme c-type cytochrome [Rhodopirellula sp. JB053]
MRLLFILTVVNLLANPFAVFGQISDQNASGQETEAFFRSESCATSTCHGGTNRNAPTWTHSFSTHRSIDPHATSGLLLLDDDSRRIVARLAPSTKNSEVAFHNVLRERCISCHATVSPEECEPSGPISAEILGLGVTCESCHGEVSGWVDQHYLRSWSTRPNREKTGFRETARLLDRAQTCVRCHVGSRTDDGLIRDVNHDLIAAGHPALRFDMLVYHRNLPKHWDSEKRSEREFSASVLQVRKVGRAVSFAAAAALSSERAADHIERPRSVPWPELADYDCFACHQSLTMASYKLPSSELVRSPLLISDGLPVWNAWHSISQLDFRDSSVYLKDLTPHRSDPQRFLVAGRKVAQHFSDLATRTAGEPPSPSAALGEIVDLLKDRPPVDWHEAAIAYLQLEAAYEDLSNRSNPIVNIDQSEHRLPGEHVLQHRHRHLHLAAHQP